MEVLCTAHFKPPVAECALLLRRRRWRARGMSVRDLKLHARPRSQPPSPNQTPLPHRAHSSHASLPAAPAIDRADRQASQLACPIPPRGFLQFITLPLPPRRRPIQMERETLMAWKRTGFNHLQRDTSRSSQCFVNVNLSSSYCICVYQTASCPYNTVTKASEKCIETSRTEGLN